MPNRITHQLLAANAYKAALTIFKDSLVNEVLDELASGNIDIVYRDFETISFCSNATASPSRYFQIIQQSL